MVHTQAVQAVARDPFSLSVDLPPLFGSLNFDTSQLQGCAQLNVADSEGRFATNADVIPVRQHELSQLRTAAQMSTNAASLQRQVVNIIAHATRQSDFTSERSIIHDCVALLYDLQKPTCRVAVAQHALTSLKFKRDLMLQSNLHPNKNLNLMACIDASPHPLHHPRDTEIIESKVMSQCHDADVTREVRRRHRELMYASTASLSQNALRIAQQHRAQAEQQRQRRQQYLNEYHDDVKLRRWQHTASGEILDEQQRRRIRQQQEQENNDRTSTRATATSAELAPAVDDVSDSHITRATCTLSCINSV